MGRGRSPGGPYAAGLMFWFTQKKFVGSYFFLMGARPGPSGGYHASDIPTGISNPAANTPVVFYRSLSG